MSRVFVEHARNWRELAFVYAVVSRRARGLSVGINLNPDQACNFDCVYCQVNRRRPPGAAGHALTVDLDRLEDELRQMLRCVVDGSIWREPQFVAVDPAYRRLHDIAFSGDGEPTTYPRFEEACRRVAKLKRSMGLDDVKIVLITNATRLDRPAVQAALAVLDAHQGEVWAKLDAGTQGYYEQVDRSAVPLAKVLANILACGRTRPIVIQTMLLRLHGQSMPDGEWSAYVDRLQELRDAGCRVERVQLYTVARPPAEGWATALPRAELEARGQALRQALPHLRVEVFPGPQD